MATAKQYLPVEQVARRLNLPGEVVEELLNRHELPGLRLGSAWLVPDAALEEFLDAEFARQNPGLALVSSPTAKPNTRPVAVEQKRKGRTQAVQLLFRGEQFDMPSYSTAVIWVIEKLAAADGTFLSRLGAIRRGKRRYVAQSRDDLYFNRPDLPAKQMRNGWWIGTNYKRADFERMLRTACEIAGLRFGVDLVITESGPAKIVPPRLARAFVGRGRSGLGDLARRHDDYLTEP
jgi:excisionase family DNA binding protein